MLGFKGKALKFSSFYFSFSFLFILEDTLAFYSWGVLNLLKVVNETRVGYWKVKEVAHFFSLSLKPNVLSVWLAKGIRKMVESNKSSTDHPLN